MLEVKTTMLLKDRATGEWYDVRIKGLYWARDEITGFPATVTDVYAWRDGPYGPVEEYLDEDEEGDAISELKGAYDDILSRRIDALEEAADAARMERE